MTVTNLCTVCLALHRKTNLLYHPLPDWERITRAGHPLSGIFPYDFSSGNPHADPWQPAYRRG